MIIMEMVKKFASEELLKQFVRFIKYFLQRPFTKVRSFQPFHNR